MYYAYILKSIKQKKFYTGHTDNLDRRLNEHNQEKNIYSRRYVPWEIVYKEEFGTEIESIKREKYFKSAAGRKWLKKYVNK